MDMDLVYRLDGKLRKLIGAISFLSQTKSQSNSPTTQLKFLLCMFVLLTHHRDT
jgi:hypothetical protein